MNNPWLKKKGMVLPMTIIVGIVILVSSFSLLSLIDNTIRMRKVSENKVAAKYAAEAGIQQGLYMYDIKINEIEILNNDSHKDNDKSKVDNFIITEDNIKNSSGEILSKYKGEYISTQSDQSKEGVFNITGSCNSAQVQIQVKIDIDTGNIISRIEK